MGIFDEEPLTGGLETARIFQVGDTVRRPAGPWTSTIHALLKHLESKGFPAPRAHGFDDEGREVLDFIEGRPGNWPWPETLLGDSGPRQVGALLARCHRAVADFLPPAPALWRHGPEEPAPGEIVLHGDFGPYNLIWRGDELAAAIDWDLARPGRAIHDAAFAAFKCVPLREDVAPLGFPAPPDRRARLEAFAEGFAGPSPAELVEAIFEVCAADIGRMERLGGQGVEPWSGWIQRGLLARTREEMAWLRDWSESEGLMPR
jgi:hypothetical protein